MSCREMTGIPTFGEVVRDHARARPDAPALRFANRTWSYAELDAAANRVANSLIRDGFVPGDRIACLGRNSDAVALLALGASRAGLIFVPVNWRLAAAEVSLILADSGSRLLFTADSHDAPGIPSMALDEVLGGDWLGGDVRSPDIAVDSADTALLVYTSGTTGQPKGVMLSHRSLFATSVLRRRAAVTWDDWGPDDVTLVSVPLAHIGGFGMMTRTLFYGGETLIQPLFEPGALLDAVEYQRVSKLALVPTAMKMVIEHPRARSVDYSRIRTIVYGTSPITLDLLREAMAVFGCQFAQSYGMTETSGTCVVLPPNDHDAGGNPRMRAAGRPLPGTEIRIVGERGEDLPTGRAGEIVLRCVSMMNGYWGLPQETARVLDADGWYRTGDAGYLDADGYLFIRDRVKDMIVSGGENIYPAEVENALADHPDIAQVAVIGVPDPLWGEAVKAVVVPVAGRAIDAGQVVGWAKTRLAGFKLPKSIDLVAALPQNAAGKVQKNELRKRYWADAERGVN